MDILLRQVKIIDTSSPFHLQKADLLIQNGIITDIGSIHNDAAKVISIDGLHVSTGWVDVFADFADPGFEYKETLETGAAAAASGGFTDVMVIPNTLPVMHNKGSIEYIVQKSKSLAVNIHPIGAVTKNTEGKELAEMYDMHASGAVAFSDGTQSIQSPGITLKALQYVKAINKTIIQLPEDKTISAHGLMNEGIVSTSLGLPGKPAISEEMMIRRDLELSKYTGSKIHFTGITTAESVKLIKDAKANGVAVTCSVTPFHLYFSDEDLAGYDTNLKLNPPLRTNSDREALREGVMNGVIDCIATHHFPQDKDHKIVEFEYAAYGMIGLQTAFAVVRSSLPLLSIEKLSMLFNNGRSLFDLPKTSINKNEVANLSLFLPNLQWTFTANKSRSNNSAFLGKELTGKPIGIINQHHLILND